MLSSVTAKLILGFWTVVHFIKLPFRRKRHGIREFLQYYGTEGLQPLSSLDKDLLLQFSECIQCGYCDTACPELWQSADLVARARFPGPSRVLISWSRLPAEVLHLDWDFAFCTSCAKCAQACPNHVPVQRAWQWLALQQKEA